MNQAEKQEFWKAVYLAAVRGISSLPEPYAPDAVVRSAQIIADLSVAKANDSLEKLERVPAR